MISQHPYTHSVTVDLIVPLILLRSHSAYLQVVGLLDCLSADDTAEVAMEY